MLSRDAVDRVYLVDARGSMLHEEVRSSRRVCRRRRFCGDARFGNRIRRAAKLSTQDATFMKLAAQGGMAEVGEATLAQTMGQSPAVKAFAAKMLADHGKANAKLAAIAKMKSVTLPSAIGARPI